MKTNHRRGYVAQGDGKDKRVHRMLDGCAETSTLADIRVTAKYSSPGEDRYNRKSLRGQKKFVRSRIRFHENAVTRQLADESCDAP